MPYGKVNSGQDKGQVHLLFEEYESLRLCDYEMKNHLEAAIIMNVSRPTFTRIYARARQKIAQSLVEGRELIIDGGKVYFDSSWYHCENCQSDFTNPQKEKALTECPLCKSAHIEEYFDSNMQPEIENNQDICICTKCGNQLKHQKGKRCKDHFCPKCNSTMIRKQK